MTPRIHYFPLVRQYLVRAVAFAALFGAPAAVAEAQNAGSPLAVTTLAGQAGVRQFANGTGAAARFSNPTGMAVLPSGDVVLVDAGNNIFRRITPGGVVDVFSGRPMDQLDFTNNTGSTDGAKNDARFYVGFGEDIMGAYTIAADSSGNVYFPDTYNNTIRKIAPDGSITTIAGAPGQQGTSDGSGSNARFFIPTGVAVDGSGNLYVADSANYSIRKVTPAGVVTTFAGVSRSPGSEDGTGTAARFREPIGIVADRSGNLYVTDAGNHAIRKITPAGVVTTFAGVSGQQTRGTSDGSGRLARFNYPAGIAIDSSGTLWVTDISDVDGTNSTIRRITAAGAVTTVAGAIGQTGSADGTGNAARFNDPRGIAVDASGVVYIADTPNQVIRRGVPATGSGAPSLVIQSQPQRLQVNQGTTATFRIMVTATPSATFQWFRNGQPIAGANSDTYSKSGVQYGDAGFYTVLVTAGTATFMSTPAQLEVFPPSTTLPPIAILAQPTDREVVSGQSVTFAVEVSSASGVTYQWKRRTNEGSPDVNIAGATTASYTIPSVQTGDAGIYSVTISNGSYTTSTAGALLTVLAAAVTNPPSITSQPSSQTANAGATVTFSVAATGTPPPTIYQWRRNGTPLANGVTSAGSSIAGATSTTLTITNVAAADAGNYSVVVDNSVGQATSSNAALVVNAAPPSSRIINLSILTPIEGAGDSFTMGYVVGGSGTSGAKPLVIRAAGPSLVTFGIDDRLLDPRMELFAGPAKSGENDNWGGSSTLASAMSAVGAFPFTSGNSLDAATQATVTITGGAPSDNSVKVSANGTGSGRVLAEVYDATPEASVTVTTPRLVNVSVLKQFGSGFTAGFVIRGATTKRVLIRAIGPGLAAFGITSGFVADPQVRLFRGTTELRSNDNWDAGAAATFTQVGAFALTPGSRDAALVETLEPADYTVQVSGIGATGIGLVEVYEVPTP